MAAAAQSNNRPHAISTEELRAQVERGLDPNAVEDQASAARTRDLLEYEMAPVLKVGARAKKKAAKKR